MASKNKREVLYKAVAYVIGLTQLNRAVRIALGPGTEGFDLLVAAEAAHHGVDPQAAYEICSEPLGPAWGVREEAVEVVLRRRVAELEAELTRVKAERDRIHKELLKEIDAATLDALGGRRAL